MHAAIARQLNLKPAQVAKVAALLDAGDTIPFLARYRQEETGGLDEDQLRAIEKSLAYQKQIGERRATIHESLQGQGVLTADLERQLTAAETLQALEDLYLPYRPKRRTRATAAREKGLEPLAERLKRGGHDLDPAAEAIRFIDPAKGVGSADDALAGARDILAEWAAEHPAVRQAAREQARRRAVLVTSKKGDDPEGRFQSYYDYREPLAQVPPHRTLAVNRGEAKDVLKVAIELPEAEILGIMEHHLLPRALSKAGRDQFQQALQDGYKRLLAPALSRDLRAAMTEQAETHAIRVFGVNLKALMLQPPLRGQTVLAIDPGFRSGCKVTVVDPYGKPLIDGMAIYPHPPQQDVSGSRQALTQLVQAHGVTVIAIGNGTAGRETETFVADWLQTLPRSIGYVVVDESGASIWSASPEAKDEFPDLNPLQRGTISLARRLQDPLAELVKLDPKTIGVGQYQHDVDQKALSDELDHVVATAVNSVGVNVNTASVALLRHVAGLSNRVAQAVVKQRDAKGPFRSRRQLLTVAGLGDATFKQCAGFLRIPEGEQPLDRTAIHPESYDAAAAWLKRQGWQAHDPELPRKVAQWKSAFRGDWAAEAAAIGIGVPTFRQIVDNLEKPGRDPRDELPPPPVRHGALSLEDLKPGMVLEGTVRNVVDFGAFVDVGVKVSGLLHRSRLPIRRTQHPLDAVSVGERLSVTVVEVDIPRQRLALALAEGQT